jgi:hypothetical protein
MRYLITLLLAALSLNAVGQGIPQFPYNPDATEDGFIGSPDLLELLSLYGEEFSSAILSENQESAIVYMGAMAHPLCTQACNNLPGFWHMSTMDDLGLVWVDVNLGEEYAWVKRNINATTDSPDNPYQYYGADNAGFSRHNATFYPNQDFRCYCATKELPRVEYKIITYNSIQYVEASINTHAQEGWRVMAVAPPNDNNSSPLPVTMWRWAE